MAEAVAAGRATVGRPWMSSGYPNWFLKKSPAAGTSNSDQPASIATVAELENYDAIIVGTGTRYGRMSSQMANFLDQMGGLWTRGALNGKVGAAFTSTATQHGGQQETTLFSIITNVLHFGMTIVGLDYGFAGQMRHDTVVGGAPYGATTIAGGDGGRQPGQEELDGARYLGRRVAEVANKLFG